jgi:hypothetical protein
MIERYDNIPRDLVESIEKIAYSQYIRWEYKAGTHSPRQQELIRKKYAFGDEIDGLNIFDKYWYATSLFPSTEQINPQIIKQFFYPLKDFVVSNCIGKPVELKKMLMNMFIHSNTDSIAFPHNDTDAPAYVSFLYYVNDSSGDTFFFNKNNKLVEKCSPKKGTGVLFNSDILHAGSYPKIEDKPRIVINMIYKYV